MALLEQPDARHGQRAGVTLLELLLAIAITLLLSILLYSVYHTISQTRRSQTDYHRQFDPVGFALVTLNDDLTATFFFKDDDACALELEVAPVDGKEFSSLRFCTKTPAAFSSDPSWAQTLRTTYRVASRPGEGDPALVREQEPLVGPTGGIQGPSTNQLVDGVSRFVAEIYDGENWVTTWPPAEETDRNPVAARITLQTTALEDPILTEVYIPAGDRIEPTTHSVEAAR